MLTVFLSSTSSDLQPFRNAVREAIKHLEGYDCIAMEDFVSVELSPADYCNQGVGRSDVILGIVGNRYGSSPPGESRSFTELEYDAAVARNIPRLMFVSPDDFPIQGNLRESDEQWQRQQEFRRRVRVDSIVASFESSDALATLAVTSLHNWARRQTAERLLSIPHKTWRSDLDPPGALLRADYGIVPFHARQAEMEDFLVWADNEKPLAARLYTGAGGMGKTRFALEACKTLSKQGWLAGFFDYRNIRIEVTNWFDLLSGSKSILVVIDYAETSRDVIVKLIDAALRFGAGKFRLVLLARGAGDWWDAIKREGQGVGNVFAGPAASRVALQPLVMTVDERRDSYHLAAASLATALQQAIPQDEPENYTESYFERVLLLHMAALAAVDGVPVKNEDGILDYMLIRERRFWEGLATARELSRPVVDGIGSAMAAITLGGGADDKAQALSVFKGVRFFDGQPLAILDAVVQLLHDSYPGKKWIEPVLPDLLGEHLVEKELGKNQEELFTLVFGPRTD